MSDHVLLQSQLDDPRNSGFLRIDRTYKINRPLKVQSHRTIEWGPMGQLVAEEDFAGVGMIELGENTLDANHVRLIAPNLDGNKARTQGPGKPGFCGIYSWGGAFCDIIDGTIYDMPCRVSGDDMNMGDGIYLGRTRTCVYWNIRGVTIVRCGRNGISIINGKYITVTDCHIRTSGMVGIDLEPNRPVEFMWGIRLIGNTVRVSATDGIMVATIHTREKRPVVIIGNTIEENGKKGINKVDGDIRVIAGMNAFHANAGGDSNFEMEFHTPEITVEDGEASPISPLSSERR